MNEKELKKLLKTKQKEMEEAAKAYNRMKYDKQISIFTDAISSSPELLEIISNNSLATDDIRLFANKVVIHIKPIFNKYAEEIAANQMKRKKKNQTRKQCRHSDTITTTQTTITTQNTAVSHATTTPTQTIPQTREGRVAADGRQY